MPFNIEEIKGIHGRVLNIDIGNLLIQHV